MGSAIGALATYPQLLVPLILCWFLQSGIVLYFHFKFDWNSLELGTAFSICFAIIFCFSSLLCFSASWLLEMMEQIESNKPLQIGKALGDTINLNLIRMLPIALTWATIWFILVVIDVLTSDGKSESESQSNGESDLSFKSATQVLARTDQEFSWTSLSIQLIKDLVRMIVFLSLPAICWRGMSGISAMAEGLRTARKHSVEFLTGTTLSGVFALILILPVALPAYLDSRNMIHIPDHAWPIMFFYLTFAWSFSIYIEQMFAAELYLWHMKWEEAVQKAQREGTIEPKLFEVQRPSLIDYKADLKNIGAAKPIPLDKAFANRRAKEIYQSPGPVKISCTGCSHEFDLSSHKELELYDYDMDSSNGIQLKCPSCGFVTKFQADRKRAQSE